MPRPPILFAAITHTAVYETGEGTMDYYLLTHLAADMGYQLAMAGAETFRVEDTMRRIL